MNWFFGYEVCGILDPGPEIKTTPLALEGEDLTTGLPGKSPKLTSLYIFFCSHVRMVER